MTVTKATLAGLLHEQFDIDQPQSLYFVDQFFKTLADALAQGEQVKLAGIGTFNVVQKAERMGRNPKTGEPYPISARRVVSFTASGKLKTTMTQAEEEI